MNTGTDHPRIVTVRGLELTCHERGEGPLVLCLHGFPDTAQSWVPVLDELAAAGFRAVAPSMRGYTPASVPADGDYRIRTLAEDVFGLMDALGAPTAHVMGHDWGAVTAYRMAMAAPERMTSLVTAAIPALPRFLLGMTRAQLWRSRYMAFFQLRGVAERRITADNFAWLHALIRDWSPDWRYGEAEFAPLRQSFSNPACLSAALGYYRALPRALLSPGEWRVMLQPLQVPTRVICGSNDGCIAPEMFTDQARYFDAPYELVTLENAGHFMQCEQPAVFAQVALEHLRRYP